MPMHTASMMPCNTLAPASSEEGGDSCKQLQAQTCGYMPTSKWSDQDVERTTDNKSDGGGKEESNADTGSAASAPLYINIDKHAHTSNSNNTLLSCTNRHSINNGSNTKDKSDSHNLIYNPSGNLINQKCDHNATIFTEHNINPISLFNLAQVTHHPHCNRCLPMRYCTGKYILTNTSSVHLCSRLLDSEIPCTPLNPTIDKGDTNTHGANNNMQCLGTCVIRGGREQP